MLPAYLRVILVVLAIGFVCLRLRGADFYVAPSGTSFGLGTLEHPYDLATALSGELGQPGDTFWLRGGDYKCGHVNSTLHGAPGNPITFRQVTGEHARVDGSITVFESMGYVVFRDFELYSSDTNRVSSQTGVGLDPTDITRLSGVSCFVPNMEFINLVIHDHTGQGIYTSQGSSNSLVYGCILFNNGWASPDNAEGHGLYIQGEVGIRKIVDNIVFNNCGANMHVYENEAGRFLGGVILDGNVAFNAGAIQNVRTYRDWIVGVDSPAEYADAIILKNNMGYHSGGLPVSPEVQIGRDSINGRVVLTENYLPLALLMKNWQVATVSSNVFAPRPDHWLVNLDQTLTSLCADWNRNTYVGVSTGNDFLSGAEPFSFSGWQGATGFDPDSTFTAGELTGTRVFVRTNRYDTGRANITVYNWDDLDNVAVDVSGVLPVGSGYEVRNAQDLFAAPVLRGVYDGQPLLLPMTNLTVATPNGPLAAPTPTGPTFNVFVLLPFRDKLQIKFLEGWVQICWPISRGVNALQWQDSLGSSEGWTEYTNNPVAVGDQFMSIEPAGGRGKFYRLRSE